MGKVTRRWSYRNEENILTEIYVNFFMNKISFFIAIKRLCIFTVHRTLYFRSMVWSLRLGRCRTWSFSPSSSSQPYSPTSQPFRSSYSGTVAFRSAYLGTSAFPVILFRYSSLSGRPIQVQQLSCHPIQEQQPFRSFYSSQAFCKMS